MYQRVQYWPRLKEVRPGIWGPPFSSVRLDFEEMTRLKMHGDLIIKDPKTIVRLCSKGNEELPKTRFIIKKSIHLTPT